MRFLFTLLVLSVLAAGCATPSVDSPADLTDGVDAVINAQCPIMGGKVTANGGSTEWNRQSIGFCCPECEPKWEALSEEEKNVKLAAADKVPMIGGMTVELLTLFVVPVVFASFKEIKMNLGMHDRHWIGTEDE